MLNSSLVRNYRSGHLLLGDLVVGVVMIEGTKPRSSSNEEILSDHLLDLDCS